MTITPRLERTRCAGCGRGMEVVTSDAGPIVSFSKEMKELLAPKVREGKVPQGSFQCAFCESYYCYDCSDMERKCSCGKRPPWREATYFDT